MSYKGYWSGITDKQTSARVLFNIHTIQSRIYSYALVKSYKGHNDVIEFFGEEINGGKVQLTMTNYYSNNQTMLLPTNLSVELSYDEKNDSISGNWSSDIGTSGQVELKRANWYEKTLMSIPLSIQISYRKLLLFISLRNIYLLFVLFINILSILGYLGNKLNTVEALLLILPLFYLYIDNLIILLYRIKFTGITRLGPLEFGVQPSKPNLPIEIMLKNLDKQFGSNLNYFLFLSRFFVPRTKMLLAEISSLNRGITYPEFVQMAKNKYIPENNIRETFEALIGTGCIKIDGKRVIIIEEKGKEFLKFQAIIENKIF